jgi:hypothetical protein
MTDGPRYIASARTAQKQPFPTVTPLLSVAQPLPSNGSFSGSTVLALGKYDTICFMCCSLPAATAITAQHLSVARFISP